MSVFRYAKVIFSEGSSFFFEREHSFFDVNGPFFEVNDFWGDRYKSEKHFFVYIVVLEQRT